MKIGTNNILHDSICNLPNRHIEAILDTAKYKNTIIGLRPINPFARDLIESGYPSKPLAVKNKSVTLGVAAGFIVLNPRYSQLPQQKYQQHMQWMKQAFHQDKSLLALPCLLSDKRIQALQLMGDKLQVHEKNDRTLLISWQKKDAFIQVLANKIDENNHQYLITDLQKNPIQVLGKNMIDAGGNTIAKPLTADYDLFILCPEESDYNPEGKDKALLDPKGGHWNARTRELISHLNDKIGEYDPRRKGNKLIHHGSEFQNPAATQLGNHLPCLIMLPEPLNNAYYKNARVILVETISELKALQQAAQKQGYYWPIHEKYSEMMG